MCNIWISEFFVSLCRQYFLLIITTIIQMFSNNLIYVKVTTKHFNYNLIMITACKLHSWRTICNIIFGYDCMNVLKIYENEMSVKYHVRKK